MDREDDDAKVARFEAALEQLIERLEQDRYVLAVVLVGRLSDNDLESRIAATVDH